MSETKCDNSLELSKFSETSTLPDFTFIIDGCKYKCKTIQICSISQVIFNQLPKFHFSEDNMTEDSLKLYNDLFIYSFDEINHSSSSQNDNITCGKLKDPHHYFQIFIDAVEGKNITITKFNAFFLNYIANVLQIEELKKASEPFMTFKLNTLNALQILFYFSESNIRNNAVINYVSSNWSQFDFPIETIKSYASNDISNQNDISKLEKMIHFPYEFFDFIFSNKNFTPRNEEWLYHFIYLLVKRNKNIKDYNLLFKYVKFEKIANVDFNKVIKYVAIDSIPSCFVDSFEKRFTSDIDMKTLINDEEYDSEDFFYDSQEDDDYDDNNPEEKESDGNISKSTSLIEKKAKFPFKHEYNQLFKGVFSFFHKKGIFNQNVKCYCGGTKQQLLFHVFEYDESMIFEYYWDSHSLKKGVNIKNAWIVVTFPNHQFKLKNYTIATSPQSREFLQKGVQPKSWEIEGSNTVIEAKSSILSINDIEKAASEIEDAKWDLIAKEDDSKAFLENSELIKTFGVEKKNHNFYRSFRFRMLKNNVSPDIQWCGLLKLNALEFYGTLVEVSKKKKV